MNTIIIGAGPAGLMAAGSVKGGAVTVLEKNEKPGKKLYITGKGRCNVTNDCTPEDVQKNVVTNPKFLFSALNAFPPREAMKLLEGCGIPLKTERGGRVFPASDKASDVTAALKKRAIENGAEIRLNAEVKDVWFDQKSQKFCVRIVGHDLSDVPRKSVGDAALGVPHHISRIRFGGSQSGLATLAGKNVTIPTLEKGTGIKSQGTGIGDMRKSLPVPCALCPDTLFLSPEPQSPNSDILTSDCLIIATGGCSYPLTGSTGDGYRFANVFGHTVIPPRPALVPLVLCEDVMPLEGLSLENVAITAKIGGKAYRQFGDAVFTADGISGPALLSLSSFLSRDGLRRHIQFPVGTARDQGSGVRGQKADNNLSIIPHSSLLIPHSFSPSPESRAPNPEPRATLSIDLKPALSDAQLDARILRDFEKYKNKQLKNALFDLLPKSLIPFIIRYAGLNGEAEINSVTKQQRALLLNALKNLTFRLKALEPLEKGIVTGGGVDVSEINPKTLESKLVKNLYFAGEILDVDALTGGYNIQIAMATGFLAGSSIGE
ncbi:MAG: NAD(P)/FAD-dependent oxidoreductase [Firmicutes bacterium]|nr:NAD(P)/FAD-dependent oxidoreductase [Bacillota bacterium]